MKKALLFFAAFIVATAIKAQTVTQTFYVDFGYNNSSTKGMKTESVDENGHYWSNVCCESDKYIYPGASFAMVNSKNETTSYSIFTNTRFSTNGKSSGGGLIAPSTEQLGDLAVASATEDYAYTEGHQNYLYFTFKGLDKSKGYRFHTFGSRTSTDERTVTYKFQGETIWSGTVQTGGKGIGQSGYNGNNDSVVVSDIVFPDGEGNITFSLIKVSGSYVPVNAMKVEELDGISRPHTDLLSSAKYFVDFGENNDDARGHQTVGADVNGNYWNNVYCQDGNLITSGNKYTLVKSDNVSSDITMTMGNGLKTNGMSGGGGLVSPTKENLGDFAINTATEDYMFLDNTASADIVISGLDKNNCYKFYFFGSRSAGDENSRREAVLSLSGQNSWSTWMITSGSSIGGQGVQGNVRNVSQSDYIYPDAQGNIVFTMAKNTANASTNYAHLNLLRIDEFKGGIRPSDGVNLRSLSVTGTAVEKGEDVSFKEIMPKGLSTGIYETYLSLSSGSYQFKGVDNDGNTVTLGGGEVKNQLVVNGTPFTSTTDQVVRLRVDSKANTCTVTPIELYVKGNIVPDNTKLEYKGDGVWSSTIALTEPNTDFYVNKTFYFSLNNDGSSSIERILNTTDSIGLPSEGFSTEKMRLNNGTYDVSVDLRNYHFSIAASIDENKISVFGSSVSNGQGATDNHGYAYLYNEQLKERYNGENSANPFVISSVAINGNSTTSLLNRYSDLTNDFGRYVIFGLSLGNEGIHGAADQQLVFDRFSKNMQTLISQARDDGKIPVVMNNYARQDFNDSDYDYIKKMNLLINDWDVPSVNMLGAIDNGKGVWATGFSAGDTYHPNTQGHREFMYAMVPSLFDALKSGKNQPIRNLSSSFTLGEKSLIMFTGEGTVHPFAVNVRVKGGQAGTLLSFKGDRDGVLSDLSVSVDEGGHVVYTSPNGQIKSTVVLSDGNWHSVTLSHYYAQMRMLLFVDDLLEGEQQERFAPQTFNIGDAKADVNRQFSELAFWRSALNNDEVAAWNSGKMLKSSLEIYASLSDNDGSIINKAQSMNTVSCDKNATGISVNPSTAAFIVRGIHEGIELSSNENVQINVLSSAGIKIYEGLLKGKKVISGLPKGIYLVNKTKVAVR